MGSEPFHFIVGPDKKTFYVHTELVAQNSPVLAALVRHPMEEGTKGRASLKDIDEDTFLHVIEFMYRNEYTVPGALEADVSLEPVTDRAAAIESEFDMETPVQPPIDEEELILFLSGSRKKHKKKDVEHNWFGPNDGPVASKKEQLWLEFKGRSTTSLGDTWKPRSNWDRPSEDWTDVLLCHARLYVFANRYQMEALQTMAARRLRLTLSEFTLHASRVPDIVALLKYTYENTMEYDDGDRMDFLRRLVSDYVVCHLDSIMPNRDFQALLQGPSSLAKDLLTNIVQNLY